MEKPTSVQADENRLRSLDEWYQVLKKLYRQRTLDSTPSAIVLHICEHIAGITRLSPDSTRINVAEAESCVVKALAWWIVLCGHIGIRSIDAMIWEKFPGLCPYCQSQPHDPDLCAQSKESAAGVPWHHLTEVGRHKERPSRLSEWVSMFAGIYPAQQSKEYGLAFFRLVEELGELAEAARVFTVEPQYFRSEAADVFACLVHMQCVIEQEEGPYVSDCGERLEEHLCRAYPDKCLDCGEEVCACPPFDSLPVALKRTSR